YWIYDRETFKIIDVNEAALKTYGYSKEEFLELEIFDLRPTDEVQPTKYPSSQPRKERIQQGDFTHMRKNGSKITVKISGYNLLYDNRKCRMVACVDITEREEFLERLKDKQARLTAAQEIAKLGYWQLDTKTEKVLVSDMMKKIWQIPHSDLSSNLATIKAALHPDDRENFLRVQKCSIQNGINHSLEYRIVVPSGFKWIQENGRILQWENGKPRLVERTVQDITEQKTYINRLSISEARYKGIVNSQTNYLIRTDMSGNYTYYNNKFLTDFGWIYGEDNIIGKPSLSSIMDYHHQAVKDIVQRCVLAPGTAFQIEIDKPLENGGARTTLWDFICLHNLHGEPSEIQCVGIDITSRVKMEEQLRDSRLRYRLITEAISDVVWDWNLKTGTMVWGGTLKSLFGYEPQDFDTMEKWEKIMPPEDSHRVVSALEKVLKGTGKNWQIEYRIKKMDGTQSYVLEKGTVIRDDMNRALRVVGAIRDITERKKLQDLLKKANSLSRIGSFEWNVITNKIYWSQMTREIHEVGEDYVPSLETAISFYKEGRSRKLIKKVLTRAVQKHEAFDEELELLTGGGRALWVRVIGHPEVENSQCVRISGSFQDIDKIKRAEHNVLQAAKEKETLLESIGDGFFAVDRQWQVTYWNKHAASLLSCPRETVIGQNLWKVFPDALGSAFHKNYEATMQDRRKRHFEAYFERTSSWFEVNVYSSQDGLSIFFKDITQSKLAKVKLKDLNKSLKAYTRELVSANKGLEQFSYIVSHNLRAPVANILGLADLLKQPDYPPEVKEHFLQEIFSNIERLDAVTSDLNDILQTKSDIKTRKEEVFLEELVEGITTSIHHLIIEERVKILLDFKNVPKITTVRSYLHSIFYNLILNSIKYKKPNVAPIIKIRAVSKGEFYSITFKDNGLGIDLTKQGNNVFNLYKRFHHHIQGKGMGLFMVKTQVEMLGGKISIKSEVDKGTSFTIVFSNNNKPIEVDDEKLLSIPNC
ncbi:MAG TPA: PAS domain S-box protein, partial [Salinimicrobium catena]|nr:PAS domain S-box protein [Salinimicrobium catena]